MATVEVFQNRKSIFTGFFKRNLYIEEDHASGEIFWSIDGQNKRVGVIRSWIRRSDSSPQILGVLPEWQLIIDGIPQEKKFYETVEDLKDKIIELEYQDYRFVVNFAITSHDV